MAAKKNTRVPRKRPHSQPVEKLVKPELPSKKMKKRKALVIAQEIKFARLLANNDKKVRDKMLKNLKKWLTVRSESSFAFTEADFMRLWKGLFYCMWMSDKPLIQEELAESLSNIVHCFDSMETALLYTKCTLKTLATEWFGIDRYRLDKFQMLVRRIIRQTFVMCRLKSWDAEWTKGVAQLIENILLDPKTTLGFSLHVTELYMEELAKIGGGSIHPSNVTELLRPFAIHLASMEDERQIRHVMKHIFRHLIFQSDVGMDYMEKFEAWRQAGFPCRNIDDMQKVELAEDEEDEEEEGQEGDENSQQEGSGVPQGPLDPRAGRVDVELPQLPFDPLAVAELIKNYKFHPKSTTKTRRQIMRLIREFSDLANGIMPLGVKQVALPQPKNPDTNPKKAAYRLMEFEKELYSDTIRRKRKRKQILPICENEDADVGFENTFDPINELELEKNGFERSDEGSEQEDDVVDENIPTSKRNKQNINKKSLREESEKSRKTAKKLNKKDNDAHSNNVEKTSKKISEKEGTEEKLWPLNKNIKLKSKKTKTKKLQNAINYFNKKLLNRSSEDTTPTKAKKSRQSVDAVWDISNNDDPPTPTMSPTSKIHLQKSPTLEKSPMPTISSAPKIALQKSPPLEKSVVIETKETVTLSKEETKQIPWLHPVLTKLEDEKRKLQQTPNKTQAEGQGGSSGSSAKKRVKIMLRNNTAQHTSEYMRQLRQSPAIPYDANRKPLSGVLKPSPLSSPVNPFYKKA